MDIKSGVSLWLFLLLNFSLRFGPQIADSRSPASTTEILSDECKPHSKSKSVHVVGERADLYLSAIVPVHESSMRGIYGCGPINERGVLIVEAFSWLINAINKDNGVVNGRTIDGSLIPGIKLGIKIYDNCDYREAALNHLIKIFPVIERGSDSCEETATLDTESIALIDLVGVSRDPRIMALSRQYHLPIHTIDQDASIATDIVAKTLAQIIQDLKWTQIAIVHSPEEHSLQIIKLLGQASLKNRFCLTLVHTLPKFQEDAYLASGSDSGAYISLLRTIISSVPENVPVFVLGNDGSVRRLFEIMSERIDVISGHQWLFSSLPDPVVLAPFLNSSVNFFTLSLFPSSIDDFEQYWHYLHSPKANHSTSDWFQEYLASQAENRRKSNLVSSSSTSRDYSLDILWRTNQVTPIIKTLFILSHTLREAWSSKCAPATGLCPDFLKMSKKEFESDFLGEVNPEDESIKEVITSRFFGGKASLGEGVNLALTKLIFNSKDSVQYKHMIAYDSDSEKGQIIDGSVVYKASPCPESGCNKCLKLRQSRIVDHQNPSSSSWTFEKRSEAIFTSSSVPNVDSDCLSKCSSGKSHKTTNLAEKASSLIGRDQTDQFLDSVGAEISTGWYLALAGLSAIGIIFIMVNGFYLLLTFPLPIANSPLDYLVLSGLISVYAVNFFFLSSPTFLSCVVRRIGMFMSYSLVLSAILVKVMNIWRVKAMPDNGVTKLRTSTNSRLIMVTCFLLSLQVIVTLVWLIIIPPRPNVRLQTCSWPLTSGTLIATESIVSLVYLLILISMNIFFSIMAWKNRDSDPEPRWILSSCASITLIWSTWLVASAYSIPIRRQSSLTMVCANLLCATVIALFLYVRKLDLIFRCPQRLQTTRSGDRSPSHGGLHSASLSGSHYGSLPPPQKLSISLLNCNGSSNPLMNTNNNTAGMDKMPFKSRTSTITKSSLISLNNDQSRNLRHENVNDEGSHCGSTSSSPQVQAEDLYPMEVYEGTGTFQPQYRDYYSRGHG